MVGRKSSGSTSTKLDGKEPTVLRSRNSLPTHHEPSPAFKHSIKSPSMNPRSCFDCKQKRQQWRASQHATSQYIPRLPKNRWPGTSTEIVRAGAAVIAPWYRRLRRASVAELTSSEDVGEQNERRRRRKGKRRPGRKKKGQKREERKNYARCCLSLVWQSKVLGRQDRCGQLLESTRPGPHPHRNDLSRDASEPARQTRSSTGAAGGRSEESEDGIQRSETAHVQELRSNGSSKRHWTIHSDRHPGLLLMANGGVGRNVGAAAVLCLCQCRGCSGTWDEVPSNECTGQALGSWYELRARHKYLNQSKVQVGVPTASASCTTARITRSSSSSSWSVSVPGCRCCAGPPVGTYLNLSLSTVFVLASESMPVHLSV